MQPLRNEFPRLGMEAIDRQKHPCNTMCLTNSREV